MLGRRTRQVKTAVASILYELIRGGDTIGSSFVEMAQTDSTGHFFH
jgi:hypothetical protein